MDGCDEHKDADGSNRPDRHGGWVCEAATTTPDALPSEFCCSRRRVWGAVIVVILVAQPCERVLSLEAVAPQVRAWFVIRPFHLFFFILFFTFCPSANPKKIDNNSGSAVNKCYLFFDLTHLERQNRFDFLVFA
jgi:hypothetical protein